MRSIVSPLDGFASPFGPQRGFNPLRIFSNDEPGVWFEANDANTLFTDVSGTTPVTAPGDAVALQLDKSGRGNHRTQATTAARPLYALQPVGGVRNLLQYTEEFDNAVWNKKSTTITTNATTSPDGTLTADKLVEDSTDTTHILQVLSFNLIATTYTFSVFLKAGELDKAQLWFGSVNSGASFDLTNVTSSPITGFNDPDDHDIIDVGDGWRRCSVTYTLATADTVNPSIYLSETGDFSDRSYLGDGTSGLFVWGAQLEEGSTATNYQRVGSFLDVSEEGKARRGRLWYNGTSHFMQTGTITPGTDKVQVFAGVRKLSDAATGILIELSNGISNGRFRLLPNQSNPILAEFLSRGTSNSIALSGLSSAPASVLFTGLGDISGDTATLRIDGIQVAQSTADQGVADYLANPIYFGARAGTSLFYNGYEDTSIIRFGPNLDGTTISKVESYVASKTPEPTL